MLPFSKKLCYIETSQSICKVDQFTEFYMIKVFTIRYFRTDYTILLLKPTKSRSVSGLLSNKSSLGDARTVYESG